MPLQLTIMSYQRLSPEQMATQVLDEGTLSIGRALHNDWVLKDPERILSKQHCTISFSQGHYILTDISANGVYLNDSEERIVRGESVILTDGDCFTLGEYEISAAIVATLPARIAIEMAWHAPAFAETRAIYSPPPVVSQRTIGDASNSARHRLKTPHLLRAFLNSAGLPPDSVPEERLPEVMHTLGEVLHETVQGLLEMLLTRAATTAAEKNPLKTPPGRAPLHPEEVMLLLLAHRDSAYLPAAQAIREGFEDMKAHQLAVTKDLHAALARLLERFDPSSLESRLQQTVFDSVLSVSRKAKYWDLFTAEYPRIADEAREDFLRLFGADHTRASPKKTTRE